MKLVEEIVKRWIKEGLSCDGVHLIDGQLAYELSGFAKSGTGDLYEAADGKVYLSTRYNQLDEIESFNDVVRIAYDWNKNSLHLGFSMNPTIENLYNSINS